MPDPSVVTRFAPSPTGYLHIGGARTALFNWLFARANDGKFVLRIEDTDRARSTDEATQAIFTGLKWLGLDWDGEAISQASRLERHAEVAHEMLATGHAYKCFSSKDEIEAARDKARASGAATLFQSPWRDADPASHPDAPFVVRLKAPKDGEITIKDKVQGKVTFRKDTLDDLVLLRADGSPTYMLAVVVDDHDMGVTHVIRGDDHLSNAARQTFIYLAMGWKVPTFAHIPLIHGPDGKKLSKRHGALGVQEYRDMGYLPAAMRNYLARLGWSHGNDEFFTDEQAIEWFSLAGIGKAPARFDFKKLDNLSGQHIRATDDADLVAEIIAFLAATGQNPLDQRQIAALQHAMPVLKQRAKLLPELIEKAHFILSVRPFKPNAGASQTLDSVSRGMLNRLTPRLRDAKWEHDSLEAVMRDFANAQSLKLGQVAQPLRAALTGRIVSPSVFDVMLLIGQDETIARLEDAAV
ncbi:MAG: glutamate--tRNA ligase [Alphaproteobacteria bacterium]|nr:glutamate--tRNA ligase [Alphaproteobacteria bacterium]